MRIPSGVTDQYIYFVAVDSTDLKTRETGLTSFTVYRSRNGGAAVAMTPTINETDTTNMPGVYELLLDEDMTIDAGNDSEEMCFHITQASMAPVTRTIELYRPKVTAGATLNVTSGAADTVTAVTNDVGITAAAVDNIWDEVLSNAAHNVAQSAGRRLRLLEEAGVIFSGTASAGTVNTITLTGGDGTNDDIYRGDRVVITGGTGQGEHGIIVSYVASSTVATMAENWIVTPDGTSEFEVVPASVDVETWNHSVCSSSATSDKPEVDVLSISDSSAAANQLESSALTIVSGTVLASPTPTTTTFASSGLDSTADHYNGRIVIFTSGALQNQASDITDYDGSGQITVTAMTEAPSATDTFIII